MEKPVVTAFVVAGAVLKKDGKYLLVQEAQSKAYGLWNLPAGRVDVGDTIEQTAVKEAKEESGFDVRIIRKLGIYQDTATDAVKHAFEAEIVGGELAIPEGEIMDARWYSYEEIKDMEKNLRGSWVLSAIACMEEPVSKEI